VAGGADRHPHGADRHPHGTDRHPYGTDRHRSRSESTRQGPKTYAGATEGQGDRCANRARGLRSAWAAGTVSAASAAGSERATGNETSSTAAGILGWCWRGKQWESSGVWRDGRAKPCGVGPGGVRTKAIRALGPRSPPPRASLAPETTVLRLPDPGQAPNGADGGGEGGRSDLLSPDPLPLRFSLLCTELDRAGVSGSVGQEP